MNLFISLIGGFCYALGFPILGTDVSIPLAPALGLALFWYAVKNVNCLKKKLLAGLVFSFGLNILGYYWIAGTVKEFGNIPEPFNYLILLLFTLITLPQLLVFLLLDHGLGKIQYYSYLRSPIGLAILYTLTEQLIPQQFPGFIGHSFLPIGKYLGLAPYLGAYFYSFVANWLAFSLASFSLKNGNLKILSPAMGLFLVTLFTGAFLSIEKHSPMSSQAQLKIRVVQPNIGNNLKISSEKGDPNSLENVLKKFYDLSTVDDNEKPDLIIWPETAYPVSLSAKEMKSNPFAIPEIHRDIMAKTKADILFGGYDSNEQALGYFESEYNAVFHLDPTNQLQNVYRKIRLLAFGEGLPFGPFNRFLSSYLSNISFFAKGSDFTLFKAKQLYPFVTVICYEILFQGFMRDFLNNVTTPPMFIVNLTNDSWFGDTSEPLQHLFLAKWRALELGIPIVRLTNTGISSVIYEDGSEGPRLGIGQEAYQDIHLPMIERKNTFYTAYGNLPTLILMFFFLLLDLFLLKSYLSLKPSLTRS